MIQCWADGNSEIKYVEVTADFYLISGHGHWHSIFKVKHMWETLTKGKVDSML